LNNFQGKRRDTSQIIYKGEIMKKRLLTVLVVLTGLFIYTSVVYACENGHGAQGHVTFDPADENIWSMKIKISGTTESIMNIVLIDLTKEEKNPRGYRQSLAINMIYRETMNTIRTKCSTYIDDSKDPVIYTWYSAFRRIKRHTKTEFENKKYEKTGLTLKEIMGTAEKLIDRDQVTVNDNTVTVIERDITSEAFNNF
jgi:hypothetical protein